MATNAGHAESFVAGSLHIRLGGPTRYPEGIKEKPWLGKGTTELNTLHARQTTALVRYSGWIALGLVVALLLIIYARAT